MRGKLIVIEGTDCSGKETQTNLLIERLKEDGVEICKFSFPMYDTPTGKIVGGPYLGKDYICDGWFDEGAVNVNPKVASLYFAADRLYNINKIYDMLNNGYNVVLDRYVYSNMAHQGGKLLDAVARQNMYEFIDILEFGLLELPHADIKVFLHMPYELACELKKNRDEKPDQHELSKEHLINAEKSYLEIAKRYDFKTIDCYDNNKVKTIEDINETLYSYVKETVKTR